MSETEPFTPLYESVPTVIIVKGRGYGVDSTDLTVIGPFQNFADAMSYGTDKELDVLVILPLERQ